MIYYIILLTNVTPVNAMKKQKKKKNCKQTSSYKINNGDVTYSIGNRVINIIITMHCINGVLDLLLRSHFKILYINIYIYRERITFLYTTKII